MSELHIEVCTIDNIQKHPNADRLDIITIKGWDCIVAKDIYTIGERVVYIPPDSIIPADIIEKYKLYSEEIQEDGTIKKKMYFKNIYAIDGSARVSTQKIRGIVSQGVVLKLSDKELRKWLVGMDVAADLGIRKWEPKKATFQANLKSNPRINNLYFDKYTNIENIKNFNTIFTTDDNVVITEKLHGTNSRYGNLIITKNKYDTIFIKIKKWFMTKFLKTHEFVYGSHNIQLGAFIKTKCWYDTNVYADIYKRYKFNEIIPEDYILYGEIIGKDIQDLEYGLDNIEFYAFDVKYKGEYLSFDKYEKFCIERNIKMVPVLYKGKFDPTLIDKYTDGNSTICENQIREGCVITSLIEKQDSTIGRKILKSISDAYLLRKNGTEYH